MLLSGCQPIAIAQYRFNEQNNKYGKRSNRATDTGDPAAFAEQPRCSGGAV